MSIKNKKLFKKYCKPTSVNTESKNKETIIKHLMGKNENI
jgi:hypothetical protein